MLLVQVSEDNLCTHDDAKGARVILGMVDKVNEGYFSYDGRRYVAVDNDERTFNCFNCDLFYLSLSCAEIVRPSCQWLKRKDCKEVIFVQEDMQTGET